jgi:hypothetical protein
MRFIKRASLVVAAVGLVAALAYAQGSVTLRLKPPAGSKFQYKVTMNTTGGMGGGGAASTMNGTYNQWYIVKSKSAKGTVIETKITNAKISGGGMDGNAMAEAMQKQVITATYSPLGAYVSGDMNMGTMGAMSAQAGVQGVIFPQSAVKVGSTWKATVDISKLMGAAGGANGPKVVSGGKIPVTYKITGMKTIAGKPVVGISAVMNGNVVMSMGAQAQGGGQMKLGIKSTSAGQVDVNTGMVRTMKTDATVNMNFGQMAMNQKVKMTVTLL